MNEIDFVPRADPLGGFLLACSNTVTQTNKNTNNQRNEMLRSEGERGRRTNQQMSRRGAWCRKELA